MPVTAAIKFVQGANVGTPGVALMGVTGTSVTASNGNDALVVSFLWTVIDSPPGSAVTPGTTGTSATFTFTPDLPGGYLLELFLVGSDGSEATDSRCFGINQASGRGFIPPFSGDSSSLNFGGTTLGWDPIMRVWLLYLDNFVGGSSTQVTSSQTLPSGGDVVAEVDTNIAAITMIGNATSVDGNKLTVLDVGLVTTVAKYWQVTDANGYQFQDPDQPLVFHTTYQVTSPRNLTWRRGTCARTSTTAWFAQ
jgi:hypothetical protein